MTTNAQAAQLVALLGQIIDDRVEQAVAAKMAEITQRQVEQATPQLPKRLNLPMCEASEILGVSTDTIYRMHDRGEISLFKLRGRTFVPVAEIERLRDTHTHNQASADQPEPPKPKRIKKVKLAPQK